MIIEVVIVSEVLVEVIMIMPSIVPVQPFSRSGGLLDQHTALAFDPLKVAGVKI